MGSISSYSWWLADRTIVFFIDLEESYIYNSELRYNVSSLQPFIRNGEDEHKHTCTFVLSYLFFPFYED